MNKQESAANNRSFNLTLSSMKVSHYVSQNEIELARLLVESLDFMQQNEKLINISGWKTSKIAAIEDIYKKWLILHVVYGDDIALAPNKILDEYWHYHILDTKKYMADCQHVFGKYLHHYPYFGLTKVETQDFLDKGYSLTQELFVEHFGHKLTGAVNKCASTGCR